MDFVGDVHTASFDDVLPLNGRVRRPRHSSLLRRGATLDRGGVECLCVQRRNEAYRDLRRAVNVSQATAACS